MPSPRAVLADITDLGLHPSEKHKAVGANGRLRAKIQSSQEQETTIEILPVLEQEIKPEVIEEVIKEIQVIPEPILPVFEKKTRRGKKQVNQ